MRTGWLYSWRGAAGAALWAGALLTAPALQAADIELKDAWARVHPDRDRQVAAYVTVVNKGPMTFLVAAESDMGGLTEIHSDTDGRPGGATRIVSHMMIAGGTELVFKPGDYAVMMTRLPRSARVGDRLLLRLIFADGTVAETEIEITGGGA